MTSSISPIERTEFLALLNVARDNARRVHDHVKEESDRRLAATTTEILSGWITKVGEGSVHVVRGQGQHAAGMGLWRGVSDWSEDVQLLDSIHELEQFFRALQA